MLRQRLLRARILILAASVWAVGVPLDASGQPADSGPHGRAQPAPDSAELPPATAIIAKYIQAIGGEEVLRGHTSRKDTGRITAAGLDGEMTTYAAAPNKRLNILATPQMGELRQGYNGEKGWETGPQGVRFLEGEVLADRARSSDFYQPLNMEKDNEIRVVGLETFNGAKCYRLSLTPRSGGDPVPAAEQFLFFDASTGLLAGRIAERHTSNGAARVETIFSDYKEFGGVQIPTLTITKAMGKEQRMVVNNVVFDEVPDSVFDAPNPPPAKKPK